MEQVAYAFFKTNVMLTFQDLLKSKEPFKWTQPLQLAFKKARETIAKSVMDGIKTSCISTDWGCVCHDAEDLQL